MYKEKSYIDAMVKCIIHSGNCDYHCQICENFLSAEEEISLLEMARLLFDKNTPFPPKVDYAGEFGDINEYYCPECDEYLSNTESEVFYCPKCGQRIKWE